MIRSSEVRLDFLAGESHLHYLVPYEKIDAVGWIPPRPGLYSWHIRARKELPDDLRARITKGIGELLHQGTLDIKAKGTLSLMYEGKLTRRVSGPEQLSDIYDECLVMLPIPLYIGISSNVNQRLRKHKAQLDHHLSHKGRYDEVEVESDTDNESYYLGSRLAAFMRSSTLEFPELLYVRLLLPFENVGCDQMCARHPDPRSGCLAEAMSALRLAESQMNHLWSPPFGRR